MLIDETQELFGVQAVSIVENPAIGSDFIALAENEQVMLAEVSKDKRVLMGACLIPDKPIFRKGEDEDYYIYFSKETIAKTAEAFFRNSNQNNATLEHNETLEGMTIFESWIVEDPNKDKTAFHSFSLDSVCNQILIFQNLFHIHVYSIFSAYYKYWGLDHVHSYLTPEI